MSAGPDVDWDALRREATDAAAHGYAPYSGLAVGAAGVLDDGTVVTGCNVENACYGLTLCAECVLVGTLHLGGGGRLLAVACVASDASLLMPCGRCRQLLLEAGGPEVLVDTADGPRSIADLLPGAFTAADLPAPP